MTMNLALELVSIAVILTALVIQRRQVARRCKGHWEPLFVFFAAIFVAGFLLAAAVAVEHVVLFLLMTLAVQMADKAHMVEREKRDRSKELDQMRQVMQVKLVQGNHSNV